MGLANKRGIFLTYITHRLPYLDIGYVEGKKMKTLELCIILTCITALFFTAGIIAVVYGEDASTGTCLVSDCSSIILDNGTLMKTDPLTLGTCFDFTGDGICEVTRISNSTVILEGDFTPGGPTSEVVYDEGPAVEEEEEAVAEEEDDNDGVYSF